MAKYINPFTDKLRFIYLNLPLFKKKAEECVTDFEKWIYVLKHMETLERIPFETQKRIFKRLEDIADIRCLKKEDMERYEESQRAVDNYNLGMYSAWIEGNEKGVMQGKLDTARKLLLMGLSIPQIMEATGLSLEQVNGLKNQA